MLRRLAPLFLASACAATPAAPVTPLDPAAAARREVTVTLSVVLPGPPERVFAAVTAEDVLPKVLTGTALLPAVVGTSGLTGPWDRPGSRRTVHLADGAAATEELELHDPPARFAYRVTGFTNMLRFFTEEARGRWSFAPAGADTAVTWTYGFVPRGPGSTVMLQAVVRPLWRAYMQVCLDNLQATLAPTA